MVKKYLIVISLLLTGYFAYSQKEKPDSASLSAMDDLLMDSTLNFDEFLNEFGQFLDSLLEPRSYFLADLSVGQGYYNFSNKTNTRIKTVQKYTWSPSLGYYSKDGFGFTASGNAINDTIRLRIYQVSLSPSYDYLANRRFALGVSYIRYLTRDSLSFYTSPLQNSLNAYFLWRKAWVQPGIATSYGWGSRTEYKKRERLIGQLLTRRALYTSTEESIIDFSVTASLRHDFYWLNIFSKKDYIKLTPLLTFTSGTQKFGFNQTTGTYGANGYNVLYSAGNVNLDKKLQFQPVSLTLYLRNEYSIGSFFIQPQLLLDYYFPADDKNFTTLFSITGGFMF